MKIGILACSALSYYVRAAQEKYHTDYPLIEVDRNYHDRPKLLRELLEEAMEKVPEDVDTGVFDCHSEAYVAKMQKEADFIRVPLNFVKGSNHVIEKLITGKWDDQFIILEPGMKIEAQQFLQKPERK